MLNTAYAYGKPSVIRYPRATGESLMVGTGENAKEERLSLDKCFKIGQAKALNLSTFEQEHVKALLQDNNVQNYELYELENSLLEEKANIAPSALGKKHKVALLVYGPVALSLEQFAQEQDLTLFDMRFIKPVDEQLISYLAYNYDLLVTFEEGAKLGGVGEHIGSLVAALKGVSKAKVFNIGLPDRFIMEGDRNQLLKSLGIDSDSLISTISQEIDSL